MIARIKKIFSAGVLLAAAGCHQPIEITIASLGPSCESGSTQTVQLDFRTERLRNLNAVFVVDTSASMTAEAAGLSAGLSQFLSELQAELGSAAKVIVHGKSSSGVTLNVPQGVYQHADYVGSHNKLAKIESGLGLISGVKIPDSARFSGPGTLNRYILVTDDIEHYANCSLPSVRTGEFTEAEQADWSAYQSCLIHQQGARVAQALEARGEAFRLSAVHSHSTVNAGGELAKRAALSGRGYPYQGLASAFGGRTYDLDQPNWTQILADLKNQLVREARGVEIEACSQSQLELVSASIQQGSFSKNAIVNQHVVLSQASAESSHQISVSPSAFADLGIDPNQPFRVVVTTRVK